MATSAASGVVGVLLELYERGGSISAHDGGLTVRMTGGVPRDLGRAIRTNKGDLVNDLDRDRLVTRCAAGAQLLWEAEGRCETETPAYRANLALYELLTWRLVELAASDGWWPAAPGWTRERAAA